MDAKKILIDILKEKECLGKELMRLAEPTLATTNIAHFMRKLVLVHCVWLQKLLFSFPIIL